MSPKVLNHVNGTPLLIGRRPENPIVCVNRFKSPNSSRIVGEQRRCMRTARRCWDGRGEKGKFVEDGRSEQGLTVRFRSGQDLSKRAFAGRWQLRHRRRAKVQKENNEGRIDEGSRREEGR